MLLNTLSILNYKNIAQADLTFSPKINCFIGSNGEGKTNLMDAIYYLSFCKSSTNPVDAQIVAHQADFMILQGHYCNEDGDPEEIYCALKRGQKKKFRRNKKDYKRLTTHIGLIPLVLVSPADSVLISGGSEERRRFMDVVISQYDTLYLEELIRYNKALQQRNALLKQENPNEGMLEIYEEMMAQDGEILYAKRARFIAEFIPIFQEYYRQISEGKEQVSLNYISHCQRGPLFEVIRRDRNKDLIMGYSLHGIHKDDLEMSLGDYSIRREGSQGQNKTFLIALKLAQFEFLKRAGKKTTPLLLLDDIFDKLDSHRVEQIVRLVSGQEFGQIFITDTNRDHLDGILASTQKDYRVFTVKDGKIVLP